MWFKIKFKRTKTSQVENKNMEEEEEEEYTGINPISVERQKRAEYTDYVDRVLSSTVFDPDDLRMMSVSK